MKQIFHSQIKTYKDSYKLLMSPVSCSDEFFTKCLTSTKKRKEKKNERKKEVSYSHYQVFTLTNSFIFCFMIHEATRHTRYQSYIQHKDDTIEMKRKLDLRIILLINYMMEENLFVYVEWSHVNRFTVFSHKKCHKIKIRKMVTPGWADFASPGPVSF